MINVIVAGAAGRMGQRIIHMIHQNPETELTGAFEISGHSSIGKDAGLVAGVGELGIGIESSIREAVQRGGVVIDFTSPESTVPAITVPNPCIVKTLSIGIRKIPLS